MKTRWHPKRTKIPKIGVALGWLLVIVGAAAKDLGTRGASWPVTESDLLEEIAARLDEMDASGELARLQDEARRQARRSLEEPAPVAGIAPALARRTRLFDPSITVAEDLFGPDGQIIAAAGTRINPLDHAPLSTELLFINGRRESEVAWAMSRLQPSGRSPAKTQAPKIILLAGRPLDLMRRHDHPFYFDMGGTLAARFGIRATPTLAVQNGSFLRLTEIPLPDDPPERESVAAPTPAHLSPSVPGAASAHTKPSTNRRQPPC